MIEGDQNTKFFHFVINHRHNKSFIGKMKLVDGRILETAKDVHTGEAQYFLHMLSTLAE